MRTGLNLRREVGWVIDSIDVVGWRRPWPLPVGPPGARMLSRAGERVYTGDGGVHETGGENDAENLLFPADG